MKILLLGDRGVGKTSWLDKLRNRNSLFSPRVDDDLSEITETRIWNILTDKEEILFLDIKGGNDYHENLLNGVDLVILFYDTTQSSSLNNLSIYANYIKNYNKTCELYAFEKIKLIAVIGTKADQPSAVNDDNVEEVRQAIANIVNILPTDVTTFRMSIEEPTDHNTFNEFKQFLKTQNTQIQHNIEYEEKKSKLTEQIMEDAQNRNNTSLTAIAEETKQRSIESNTTSSTTSNTTTTTTSKQMSTTMNDDEIHVADKTFIIHRNQHRQDEQPTESFQKKDSHFSACCYYLCWGIFWSMLSSVFFAICGAIAGVFDRKNIIDGFHIPEQVSTLSFSDISPVWRGTLYGATSGLVLGGLLFMLYLLCKAFCYTKKKEPNYSHHVKNESFRIPHIHANISQTFT
jgi:GTPase SAR1 family protein